MAARRTVAGYVLAHVAAVLRAHGTSPDRLLVEMNLTETELGSPDRRVPLEAAVAFWTEAETLWGRPRLGLMLSEHLGEGYPLLRQVLRNSASLGDAYGRWCRFYGLIVDFARQTLERTPIEARLGCDFDEGAELPPMVQDWMVAQWMMLGRSLVGRTWAPRRVAVRHQTPGDADAYERWFNAPVAFGAERVEIVFDAQLLDLPVVGADPALVRLLDRHIEQVLARLPRAASLVDRARAEAARSISDGASPTAASIARSLNMSERTLLRRLSEEDATPSDIIADVRRELASQYLRDPAVSITEAAFLLGYSEPSAFHRAFKRWTGVTPAEFRERTAGA